MNNDVAVAVGDVIGPYIPLIQAASSLVANIIEIGGRANYNKKLCNALADRVEITRASLELLQRRKTNELSNEVYDKALNKLIYVLTNIKGYIMDISKIHGFRRYTKANAIKKKYKKLTEEYENAMKDLQFTMTVASEERRRNENENLAEDIVDLSRHLGAVDKQVNNISDQIMNNVKDDIKNLFAEVKI
jgi:hypothetical protein